MNRTQKFAINTTTSMTAQVVTLISGLITPRLMIQAYGSEINGLVSSLNQFISYISLVEAGIGGAAIFSLYKPLAKGDSLGVSSIVVSAKKSYLQAGYLFSSGILVLAIVYGLLKCTETLSFWTIFFLTIILSANTFVDFFFVAGRRSLLTADQRNYVISIANIANNILKTVFICVLATVGVNVLLVYTVTILMALLKLAIIFFYTRKQYPYLDLSVAPDKSSMGMRWDVVYQQILAMIQSSAPTVIATILLDLVTVSVYSVYNMIIHGLNGILSVFVNGLPAGFGDLIAKKEEKNLQKTVVEFEVAYYYMLSIAYGLTMVLIMPFIAVYTSGLTDVNYYEPLLGFVIVLNGILYNIKTPQSMLIQSAGLYKEMRWRSTWQAAIIVTGGFVLGYFYGMVGILIGSCISNLFRTIDLLFFIPKRVTHNSIFHTAKRLVTVFLNIAIIYMPSILFPYAPNDYGGWIILALIYGVYSVAVVTITTLLIERKAFYSVCRRFGNILVRRKRT